MGVGSKIPRALRCGQKGKKKEFRGTSEGGKEEGEVADVPYHKSVDGLKAQMP